ncbi:hypothetical protein CJF57_00137 [Staphylococcus phage UPMK_1]|nr:hypothetical protein CJF57_00137 [Staphylococcus phage UPMK_1]
MMKIHLVGDEIANGQGIGRGSVVGTTLVAETVKDLEGKDLSDKVIVTNSIDETFVPYVEKALGLITEENGITSPSAIVGLEKGIPTVVGVLISSPALAHICSMWMLISVFILSCLFFS